MRLSFAVLALFSSACVARGPQASSEAKDLIASADAKNVALVMSGLNKDDDERWIATEAVAQLKGALETVRGATPLEVREHHDVKTEDLVKLTAQAAKDVGENGTLIWYIGTHGWNDGFSTAGGARVKPQTVMEALRSMRTTPIRRLVLLFDYCGAGGMVDGLSLSGGAWPRGKGPVRDLASEPAPHPLAAMWADALKAAGPGFGLDEEAALYKTAIYFAPVTRLQTTSGDTFTAAMASVIAGDAARTMTIGQFLEKTVAAIGETTTSEYPNDDDDHVSKPQKAVFRALPDSAFLQETLFSAQAAPAP